VVCPRARAGEQSVAARSENVRSRRGREAPLTVAGPSATWCVARSTNAAGFVGSTAREVAAISDTVAGISDAVAGISDARARSRSIGSPRIERSPAE
jgi:hypothetical protein